MDTDTILKYLNDSTSLLEIKEVEAWIISSPENTKYFNHVKAQHIVATFNETTEVINIEKALNKYKSNIKKSLRDKPNRLWHKTLKYAAMITLIFSSSYYLVDRVSFKSDPSLPTLKDAITLTLENGNTQVIEENGSTQVVDSKGNTIGIQKENKLYYNNDVKTEKLTYNTLTVPNGKRFDIFLSDNTHIFLNAGSSLKYPVKFIKGQKREVFLNGEAFFEVAKDASHPFVVNVNDLKVRVLGTKFNVCAYIENLTTKTVLVEGSVSLYQEDTYIPEKATFLTPGYLASVNRNDKSISLQKVDVSIYTSWIKGTILFKHEPFNNILKILERQYNVVITNNNKELNEELFTASFDNVSLEYILQTFQRNYDIEYTFKNNNVIINP